MTHHKKEWKKENNTILSPLFKWDVPMCQPTNNEKTLMEQTMRKLQRLWLSTCLGGLCARWGESHAMHMPNYWGMCHQIIGLHGKDEREATSQLTSLMRWDEMRCCRVKKRLRDTRFVSAQPKQLAIFLSLFPLLWFIPLTFTFFAYLIPIYHAYFGYIFIYRSVKDDALGIASWGLGSDDRGSDFSL